MPSRESRRASSKFNPGPPLIDPFRTATGLPCGGEPEDDTDRFGGLAARRLRTFHVPSNAFARQLLLALARAAAVSESFSFSA